jgi:hypothetical protein
MGLVSFIESIFFARAAALTFICRARFFTSAGVLGKNSCSGGSSKRIVTGKPFMTLKISVKSPR